MFLKIWVNFKTKSLYYKNNNGKGKLVYILLSCLYLLGFPGSSEGKESACNVGDLDSIPGQEDLLEKGMAIHSRVLAQRIPWTEETGGLQSMGSQRDRHN